MLELLIKAQEGWNAKEEVFIQVPETKLELEHSLISVKKWEAKWHKPFLGREKNVDEIRDYVRCMTIGKREVDPLVYRFMPNSDLVKVIQYIKDDMTATWFSDPFDNKRVGAQKSSKEVITAEIIYYWMISLQIPVEFEKWHLNQLLTLIRVVNEKNKPKEKINPKLAAKQRAALNAQRRAKYHTTG